MNSRRCEAELYRLKDVTFEMLKSGKIDESSYDVIKERIDEYLNEVREQIVDERLGGFPRKLKDSLEIPSDARIVGAIAFGISNENPRQPPKKSINEIFHFDKWSNKQLNS